MVGAYQPLPLALVMQYDDLRGYRLIKVVEQLGRVHTGIPLQLLLNQ